MNFEPPDELRDALNTVVQAKSDVDAALFRSEGECQQRLLAAQKGVGVRTASTRHRSRNGSARIEARRAEKHNQVLDDYVARRRAEVLSESRHVYVRGTAQPSTTLTRSAEQKVTP